MQKNSRNAKDILYSKISHESYDKIIEYMVKYQEICFAVAVASGGALIGSTVIVTVSELLRLLSSDTVNSKTNTLISPFTTDGDVKLGVTLLELSNETDSPDS